MDHALKRSIQLAAVEAAAIRDHPDDNDAWDLWADVHVATPVTISLGTVTIANAADLEAHTQRVAQAVHGQVTKAALAASSALLSRACDHVAAAFGRDAADELLHDLRTRLVDEIDRDDEADR